MGILEQIEGSAIATFVRESPSLFAYTAVLSAHAVGLAILVGANTVVSLRLLGAAPAIPLSPMSRFFPVMYVGLTINAISGLLLLAANATGMLVNPVFVAKLVLVFLGVAAMVVLQQAFAASSRADELADGRVPGRLKGLAWISLVLWLLAVITGRLSAYPFLITSWFQ